MKQYTDIEQSKKLAEILPKESADMYYLYGDKFEIYFGKGFYKEIKDWYKTGQSRPVDIPCWSLAELLEQLDDEITDEEGNDYNLTIVKESLKYQLYYHDSWGQAEDIETDCYDDMVDACVEMILKLHELNLL